MAGLLTPMDERERDKSRAMEVHQRKDMIQNSRIELSVQEQRIVLYAVSQIKPTDTYLQPYTFDIQDFYKLAGIENQSYTDLKKILIGLRNKAWWMKVPDGSGDEITVAWFSHVKVGKKSGKVTLEFDREMMPYLCDLARQALEGKYFTTYTLKYILPMRSQYSQRLYELLKSYQYNNQEWFFTLENLRYLLDCQKEYPNFADLKKRVLDPAVAEINAYTDLAVDYKITGRKAKRVTELTFYMMEKGQAARLAAEKRGREEMDGQMTLDDIMKTPDTKQDLNGKYGK